MVKGKKAAPWLPGAEQITLNTALQCNQNPPKSKVSLAEAHYLSLNDLASKWWSYRHCLRDRLLFSHRYRSIHDEGVMKRDLHVPHVFLRMSLSALVQDTSSQWPDSSEDAMSQSHPTEISHQQGDPSKTMISGSERKPEKNGCYWCDEEPNGRKAKKDGVGREIRRRRLQEEKK